NRLGAVPEEIEHSRKLLNDRSVGNDIIVTELRIGVDLEVLVSYVTATDQCECVVGHHQFIVHAAIEPALMQKEVDGAKYRLVPAVFERVENPDLDLGMRRQRKNPLVSGDSFPVIHQYSNANPAIGGP